MCKAWGTLLILTFLCCLWVAHGVRPQDELRDTELLGIDRSDEEQGLGEGEKTLRDPAACADLWTRLHQTACSVDHFKSLASTIAFSLECEFRRTNNLLDIIAALFERTYEAGVLAENSSGPLSYANTTACSPKACQNCLGMRWAMFEDRPMLMWPQPELTGASYSYPSETPRPLESLDELRVNKDAINDALRFACLGTGLDNFGKTGKFLFTPHLHNRLRYIGSDPAMVIGLWESDLKRAVEDHVQCQGLPMPKNLIDETLFRRFFNRSHKDDDVQIPTDDDEDLRMSWSPSRVRVNPYTNKSLIISQASRVAFKSESKPMGALVMDVNMSHLGEVLQSLSLSPSVYAVIVQKDGEVVMSTQRARDVIFVPNMTETGLKQPKNSSCIDDPDCRWIPRTSRAYTLHDAETYNRFSGMKFGSLLDKVFESKPSDCMAGVRHTSISLPKRRCETGCDHAVAYCSFTNVPEWALLIFTPAQELLTAASFAISDDEVTLEVDCGSKTSPVKEFELRNEGRVVLPFVVDGGKGASIGSVLVQPDKGILEPHETILLQVSYNMTICETSPSTDWTSEPTTSREIIRVTVDPDGKTECLPPPAMAKFHVRLQKPTFNSVAATLARHWTLLLSIIILLVIFILQRLIVRILRRYYGKIAKDSETLDKALHCTSTVSYPMVLLQASVFTELGKFVAHEEIIDRAVWLHTMEEIDRFIQTRKVIFCSHQWTAFSEPDPTGKQYKELVMAVDALCSDRGWSKDSTYVWLDYSSIPQRHAGLQTLAINSLTVYAAKVSAFIVVAPEIQHADLEEVCDSSTYQRRAWCRAEQLSHLLVKSDENMFLAESGRLTKLSEEWLGQSVQVFQGDMTCCRRKHVGMQLCDRERLVVAMLGIWAQLCKRIARPEDMQDADHARFVKIHGMVMERLDEVFPATFNFVTETGKKERPLFGRLLQRLSDRLADPEDEEDEEED
eukprot:gb/GFBE01015371.1/.p1 GENE.gb/GFBE01015371.1/~~gb/GFBE01015371.1/.p1  ORF type:complete len:961 (+),score=181.51 gb/GFBE01015371.1/:1-2883(+)